MSFDRKRVGGVISVAVVIWCAVALLAGPSAQAQLPELWVRVSDVTSPPGMQNAEISIYLNNYQDTVAGFNLWIQLDRPDIMEFQTDSSTVVDTSYWECLEWDGPVCIDSLLTNPLGDWDFIHIDTKVVAIGNFDSTGTLISGWEMVDARSLTGGFDLNIAGISFTEQNPDNRGIAPQQGGMLIKILADVFDIPDTMTDRTVNMMIQHAVLDHYNFSRPDGSSIGIVYDTVPDTNCYICTAWAGDVCTNWERVSLPPPGGCDSIDIDTVAVARVDTTTVTLIDGSLTVLPSCCVNRGNADGVIGIGGPIDVADLTYLVRYLFKEGPEPPCLEEGNADGVVGIGGPIDVADLTYLVRYLFKEGPEPPPC